MPLHLYEPSDFRDNKLSMMAKPKYEDYKQWMLDVVEGKVNKKNPPNPDENDWVKVTQDMMDKIYEVI